MARQAQMTGSARVSEAAVSGDNRPEIGDFPPGSRIAGYQVEQVLGRGGMAVVYRAADVRLDRQVALKVLAPELTRDSAFRQRFIRESRSGAAVDHPNIIPVFEAGEAEGVLFIAMRYVAERDLRRLIEREGPLELARVGNIVAQVASALDAAHARGLVHRDVKPANMLLGAVARGGAPDHIYLSDFGLSKLSVAAVSLTDTGQFLGTLDYMSPEQVESRPVDGRTDLYSLGCSAFEMLTGRPPFQRDQDLAVMWAQVSEPPPSARQLRPELPAAVDGVLARAMAKRPDSRQATCMEFASQLSAALRDRPAAGTPVAASSQAATEAAMAAVPGVSPGPGLVPPDSPGEATVTDAASGYAEPRGYRQGDYRQGDYRQGGYRQGGYGPGPGYRQAGYTPPQGYPPAPQTRQEWPAAPPRTQPGGRPPRRGRTLPFLAGMLVVLLLAGAALLVLHALNKNSNAGRGTTSGRSHSPRAGSSSPTSSSSPALATPAGVVRAYYAAINHHQYHTAYKLSAEPSKQPFGQFKQGYESTTRHVTLTITGVSGNVVSVQLVATQLDGSVKKYSGTYTVSGGKLISSNIQPG